MALRKTLNEVIEAVRNETRKSTNTSRGIDHRDHIKQLIKRHYTTLCEDFDWQHLELKRDSTIGRVVLQAGLRYYNFPAALNPLYIEKVWVKFGSTWRPLDYGIDYGNYSAYNSDSGTVRADPCTHWSFYGGSQFEIWPIPSSNGAALGNNELAFTGQMLPEQLTGDASRLDMDDILVTLMVSAEILGEEEQKSAASIKAEAATARLLRIRGNLGSKKTYCMGLGEVNQRSSMYPRHPTYIR